MDLIYLIIIILIPTIAQVYVMSNYNKYKNVELKSKQSGFEVARKILDENGLQEVHVVETRGTLSDHYDPSRKVVRLSSEVFHGESVSAASIAAHEVGHALQDKDGYFYMKFRSIIFPVVKIATQFSYIIIVIGLLAELTNLFYIGIGLIAIGLFFQLITLPVEFNASNRAKEQLEKYHLTADGETDGTNAVLGSAAMTYVAGVITSALEILRLIMIFGNRRR